MGQISLQIPQMLQPDSTEEAKVASDFTAIQAVINGGLDTSNLATNAGILATQLAGGAFLMPVTSAVSAAVAADQFLNMTGASTTATLPVGPPNGTFLGVKAGSAIVPGGPITVSAASPLIVYPGAGGTAVSSLTLGMSHAWVALLWNGVVWSVVGGDQDTGWVALTLGANVSNLDSVTPSARLKGNRVWLQGAVVTTGAIAANGAIVTVPGGHGLIPPASMTIPVIATGNAAPSPMASFTVGAAGKISTPTALNTAPVAFPLNGLSYDLST